MKKTILIIGTLLSFSLAITSCDKKGKEEGNSTEEKTDMEEAVVYTCSMHPEVTSDKPGKCPKCEMDLVEKKENNSSSDDHKGHDHEGTDSTKNP